MDTLSLISAIPSITVLVVGFAMFARDRGYGFDLRNKSQALPFGRRASDPGKRMRLQTSSH